MKSFLAAAVFYAESHNYHFFDTSKMDPEHLESNEEVSESKNQKTLILCPQCKKGFPTPSKVKRHLLAVHEKIREFQCDICTHAFSQKIHVLKHRQAVHKSELEANPHLLNNRNFRIHTTTVVAPSTVQIQEPFETCTIQQQQQQQHKPKKRKKKSQSSSSVIKSSSVNDTPIATPMTTSTTSQVVIQQPTILHLNLDLQALEPTSSSGGTNFNENKPITCQVKLCAEDFNLDSHNHELENTETQLALDDNKFDLSKLTQQSSFENELEKTLAQLQPIAKEFAAFEDMQNQEKIFQELVPLNDIKPTIFEEIPVTSVKSSSSNRKASPCDVCGKSFSSPSKMRRHKRIVHEKIKPFQCSVCSKEFGQKVNLVGHLQSKHKLSEDEAKNGIIKLEINDVPYLSHNKIIIQPSSLKVEQPEEPSTTTTTIVKIENSTTTLEDNNKKIFKCMECLFDSEDSGDMISHHLSKHVQPMPMFSFDTSDLSLE